MPRNFNKYQYETSPRKLEPEYTPVKNPYKSKKTTARKIDSEKGRAKEKQLKKQKYDNAKEIYLGICDTNHTLTLFPVN